MPEALGDFDPKATYDAAALDYEDASRDFWQYLSTRTVNRLNIGPGELVLDVPCGTGPSVLAAAARVGPSGAVVGIDYAEQMLAICREKVTARGLDNVTLATGDMTALERPPATYDAVMCVLGIFFVDDMPDVVGSFRRLLQPHSGRVGITVFGERFFDPMRDVFVAAVADVAPGVEVIPPWCRTETESALRGIFDGAGFGEVRIHSDDDILPLPSAADWWRIVMGSGLRRTVTAIGEDKAAEVRRRCDAYVAENSVTAVVSRTRYAIAT